MALDPSVAAELDDQIKNLLSENTADAAVAVANLEKGNDELLSAVIEKHLKEIRELSLVSVTAAPFSLQLLGIKSLLVNEGLLISGFLVLLINVICLTVGRALLVDLADKEFGQISLLNMQAFLGYLSLTDRVTDTGSRVTGLGDISHAAGKAPYVKKEARLVELKIVRRVLKIGLLALVFGLFLIGWSIIPVLNLKHVPPMDTTALVISVDGN